MIKRYAVLLTCFNRKEVTLRCLEQLHAQKTEAAMDVFLCDDGSSDGTFDAVRGHFPNVRVFKGTGNLFWNRGMLASWKKARETKDYDAYIWLNDDTFLYDDALTELLDCSRTATIKASSAAPFVQKAASSATEAVMKKTLH